jgi:prophage antirepressor-like protein
VSHLIPFLFENDTTVRITDRSGNPWFIAADVCRPIGIKNHRDAVEKLDEDEKGVAISDTLGGPQELLIVSESGLYSLVLRSHAAITPGTKAHRFRKWVTAELIPSIRKTGQYAIEANHPQSLPGEKALTWPEKCRIVEMYQKMSGARAAAEKALSLGFESVPALDAQLRQAEFKFILDLNTNGPIDVAEVN